MRAVLQADVKQEDNVNEAPETGAAQAGADVYLRAQPLDLHQK
jgi:hypothetical protein